MRSGLIWGGNGRGSGDDTTIDRCRVDYDQCRLQFGQRPRHRTFRNGQSFCLSILNRPPRSTRDRFLHGRPLIGQIYPCCSLKFQKFSLRALWRCLPGNASNQTLGLGPMVRHLPCTKVWLSQHVGCHLILCLPILFQR